MGETEMLILAATNRVFKSTPGLEHVQWSTAQYTTLLKKGNTETRLAAFFDQEGLWPEMVVASNDPAAARAGLVRALKMAKDVVFEGILEEPRLDFKCRP